MSNTSSNYLTQGQGNLKELQVLSGDLPRGLMPYPLTGGYNSPLQLFSARGISQTWLKGVSSRESLARFWVTPWPFPAGGKRGRQEEGRNNEESVLVSNRLHHGPSGLFWKQFRIRYWIDKSHKPYCISGPRFGTVGLFGSAKKKDCKKVTELSNSCKGCLPGRPFLF